MRKLKVSISRSTVRKATISVREPAPRGFPAAARGITSDTLTSRDTESYAKDRSCYSTFQARRCEGRPARSGHRGHDHSGGARPWAPEGPHRVLSRPRIHRRPPAQNQNRNGGSRRNGRESGAGHPLLGAHRQNRRWQNLHLEDRRCHSHPERRTRTLRALNPSGSAVAAGPLTSALPSGGAHLILADLA